ncbi:MAG: hypothetical protein ACR2RV_25670 [Verrucomicrobiales bacterium]
MSSLHQSYRITLATILLGVAALLPQSAVAEDWKRVTSKDGKISALFPVDIRKNPKTQVDRTLAGKVESKFGEYYGDGIMLAGSGSDIPRLALAASDKRIFESSKKTFLAQAKGKELSFKASKLAGVTAWVLLYKGDAYQGKGEPYQGRAFFLIVNKRMYVLNSVISKATPANKASEKKLFDSVKVSK